MRCVSPYKFQLHQEMSAPVPQVDAFASSALYKRGRVAMFLITNHNVPTTSIQIKYRGEKIAEDKEIFKMKEIKLASI